MGVPEFTQKKTQGATVIQFADQIPNICRHSSISARSSHQSTQPENPGPRPLPTRPDPRTLPATGDPGPNPPSSPVTTSCHRAGRGFVDLGTALDLRRKASPGVVEALGALSRHCAREERALLEAVFVEGRSVAELAGLSGESVRCCRRRVRRAVARVVDPRFAFVASCSASWPALRKRVGRLHILEGLTMSQTAERLGVSTYRVRRECAAIDTLMSIHTRTLVTSSES